MGAITTKFKINFSQNFFKRVYFWYNVEENISYFIVFIKSQILFGHCVLFGF